MSSQDTHYQALQGRVNHLANHLEYKEYMAKAVRHYGVGSVLTIADPAYLDHTDQVIITGFLASLEKIGTVKTVKKKEGSKPLERRLLDSEGQKKTQHL